MLGDRRKTWYHRFDRITLLGPYGCVPVAKRVVWRADMAC